MVMVMIVIMMMVMIVIMVMMVVVMIVIMMVMIIVIVVIVVVFMVGMMSHVGGHYTRQADRIMGMVVAVPLSRGRSGRERHSAKTSASGNREGYYSFTRHEERSFD
jgi:uncharacterized membrane protein YgcG